MKKTRINTTLRGKLQYYVKSQIEAAIDHTPLLDARRREQGEALRLLAAAYPAEDMAILAKYGQSRRYSRFDFQMPQGESRSFDFSSELPCDLPNHGSYRFEPEIEADAAFIAAVFEADTIEQALRAEASRQWKQAEVLVGCALYFEDILDYLCIPQAERVSLAQRWRLQVAEPVPASVTLVDPEINENGEITWPSNAWEDGWDDEPEEAAIAA
jgi:hypothetical protein